MRIDRDELRKKLIASGVSQSALAKGIGMSTSVISTYLAGKYQGDIPTLEIKIREWLALQSERAASETNVSTSIIETTAYIDIQRTLRIVERSRKIGLITGCSGVGKTTSLREFARQHPSVLLIEADHGYTARALFVELCESLNLDTRGSLHDLLGRVVGKLAGSGRLIIIDEAEHLPYRALELVRRIYDKADVGVALVGMPRLKTNLQGNPNWFEQLYSRIRVYRKASDLSDGDIDALVGAWLGPVDGGTLTALRNACKRNARILVNLAEWCSELVRINQVALSPDVVREAAELVVVA